MTVTVQDAVEGRVIDAPLSGSSVFIDLDGDSVQDADEPTTTSDADGYFAVKRMEAAAGVTPRIISVGGTDTQTSKELPNLALISQLPSDATKDMAVTPLTTVVSAAATPEAKTKLLAALGISGTVEELITQDTWALAQAGDETAKSLQKKNQQIALNLQTADSLIDTDSATKATDLSEAVADQLVSLSASSDSVDLSSSTVVSSVLTDAVTEVDSSVRECRYHQCSIRQCSYRKRIDCRY